MIKITEDTVIDYVKERKGWVDDTDLNLHFIPEESNVYSNFQTTIKSLIAQGKLVKTDRGYKLNKGGNQ